MVLCEKPLALSLAEATAMADAARRVPTLVWFNYRRVPAIAYAKQLIDQGRLGTVYHYDAAYRQQWGPDTSRAGTWKMDRAQAGSGVADDLLTHLLDTAMYLNGPVQEGIATTRTFMPDRPIDDAFLAMLKFANGSVGTFEATRFGIGCKNSNSFQMHGSGGMLRFDLERLNHLQFLDATTPSVEQGARDLLVTDMKHPVFPNFWRPGHIIGYEHTFIATLAEFLDAVSRGADFHPNFADALEVQRVLDALQRSVATRQWTAIEAREGTRAQQARHIRAATRSRHDDRHREQRGPLVEDAVDDRRVAVGVDGDQPARSPDHQRARAHPARGEQVVGHAVRLHRGLLPDRHDDRPGAGGVVHGSRRHPDRTGHDLCRVVGRRRRPGAGVVARGVHRSALPHGPDRVRQLHRGDQGDRGPVSRREPLDRRRRLQRGRAARIGDRAAVRARACCASGWA